MLYYIIMVNGKMLWLFLCIIRAYVHIFYILTCLEFRQNFLIFETSLAENTGATSLLRTSTLFAIMMVLNVPEV